MEIKKEGNKVTAFIVGKLDRSTSPGFSDDMEKIVDESVDEIVIDLKDAIYISSAGLRIILALEKKMENSDGNLTIRNMPDMIMEVFVETGLSDILTLE